MIADLPAPPQRSSQPTLDVAYSGREQTAAKHFLLRQYLRELAFKLLIGGFPQLTFVDGFSGPWKSRRSDYSDTSFMIAIDVLKEVRASAVARGKAPEIRCFFVEASPKAFARLHAAVMPHNDPTGGFRIQTFNGPFVDAIPAIRQFAGASFTLSFIDPTGWTGFDFDKISSLLSLKGEVLVNFMYDHISRFTGWDDDRNRATFNGILGGPGWRERMDPNLPPGAAALKLFCDHLKAAGNFGCVLATTILKVDDRPHFSIAYGTRSRDGLIKFRDVERQALRAHDLARSQSKVAAAVEKTGQLSFLSGGVLDSGHPIDDLVRSERTKAKDWLCTQLASSPGPVPFSKVVEALLMEFVLRETDVKDICVDLAELGRIRAPWREEKPRRHKPSDHHLIALTKPTDVAPA